MKSLHGRHYISTSRAGWVRSASRPRAGCVHLAQRRGSCFGKGPSRLSAPRLNASGQDAHDGSDSASEGGAGEAAPVTLGQPRPAAAPGPAAWGPLAWLLGGGRDATQRSTMPEVSVDLGEAVRQPIFLLLYKLYEQHGPIFRMTLGPKRFLVISDPAYVKQILVTSVDRYSKGILAEILEFVMGQGLLAADGEQWMARRRVVAPALHRGFVASQVELFGHAVTHGLPQLESAASTRGSVDMESFFSRLSLDVVGKAVFDYEFDSLTHNDPTIRAVYTVLKEAEARSTAPFPYWKLPGVGLLVPRLRESDAALGVLNDTLDRLVNKARRMAAGPAPSGAASGSVLEFLVASGGEDLSSRQLRDDLMTLLIAGHETTAAALTWALHLLVGQPEVAERLREEVDSVLGDRLPLPEDLPQLRYTSRVLAEALRLYPQPPVLIRRAVQDDLLGGVHPVPAGTDLFISVWNLHRSPSLWEQPDRFWPERFGPLDGPAPTEATTDFHYLPFGGGRRRCVGDIFATAEAVVALAVLLRRYDFTPDPSKPPVGVTTGATIHTSAGLHMLVTRRDTSKLPSPKSQTSTEASAGHAACPHANAAGAVMPSNE